MSSYGTIYVHSSFTYLIFKFKFINSFMTKSLLYRNQSNNLLCKSMDWFLYDRDLRHERVKEIWKREFVIEWYTKIPPQARKF